VDAQQPNRTLRGQTVTVKGMELIRAADLVADQVYDVVKELSAAVEDKEFNDSHGRELDSGVARLLELRGRLETLDYGNAEDPVEVPLEWLFPQLQPRRLSVVR